FPLTSCSPPSSRWPSIQPRPPSGLPCQRPPCSPRPPLRSSGEPVPLPPRDRRREGRRGGAGCVISPRACSRAPPSLAAAATTGPPTRRSRPHSLPGSLLTSSGEPVPPPPRDRRWEGRRGGAGRVLSPRACCPVPSDGCSARRGRSEARLRVAVIGRAAARTLPRAADESAAAPQDDGARWWWWCGSARRLEGLRRPNPRPSAHQQIGAGSSTASGLFCPGGALWRRHR
ncbi:unnamed protein product, partial [Urochloa humidicola]